MTNGKVHVLTQEEIEAQEDRRLVIRQMMTASEVILILKEAIEAIKVIEMPLNWPNRHFDKKGTLDMLLDLMPDQTIQEMELEAEVRRAEMRANERNGQ